MGFGFTAGIMEETVMYLERCLISAKCELTNDNDLWMSYGEKAQRTTKNFLCLPWFISFFLLKSKNSSARMYKYGTKMCAMQEVPRQKINKTQKYQNHRHAHQTQHKTKNKY